MKRGIWTTPTTFQAFADRPDRSALLAEIATRQAAGVDLFNLMGCLPDPDIVLRERGDGVDVLREVASDSKVLSCVQVRKLATLGKGIPEIAPGAPKKQTPTPEAQALCRDLEADLERLDLPGVISEVLDAPYYGFTPVEIIWEAAGGRYRIKDLRPRPVEWFGWDSDGRLVFKSRLTALGEAVPAGKFLVARHFPSSSNPYGVRLLSACLWSTVFRRGGWQFFVQFAERFGIPWTVAQAGSGASPEQIAQMKSALAAMVQDAVAVLKGDAKVDLLQADGKGEVHPTMIRMAEDTIAQVLMGQTLTSEASGKDGTGSRALGQVHFQVLEAFTASDERLVTAFLNELAWTYKEVNASGQDTYAPEFAYAEPEDYAAAVDMGGKLKNAGAKPTGKYFTNRCGLTEEEFEIIPEATGAPATGTVPGFAAPPAPADDPALAKAEESQAAIDRMVTEALPEGAKAAGQLARAVADAVAKAESYQDLLLLLAEIMGDKAGLAELEDLTTRLMANGAAFGRAAVTDEDKGGGHGR
jgi:phage gp29-like protein